MKGPIPRKRSGVSRRSFLKAGGVTGAALVVGVRLDALAQPASKEKPTPNPFDAWVRIGKDDSVTLVVAKSEMGQGIFTSLPMILAEELDVDWARVKVEQAATNPDWYSHGTGGSSSVRTYYTPLRQAGAAARALLVQAAAAQWKADASKLTTEKGVVMGPAGQRASYGSLVEAAAKLPVPDHKKVALKDPARFRIVGTSVPRADLPSKVDGTAQFGLDVRVPGMLYAVVARPPAYGGKFKSYDATKAKAVKGVRQVVELPKVDDGAFTRGGIAVVAESRHGAIKGRDALQIEWDGGPIASWSNDSLRRDFEAMIAKGGKVVRDEGDTAKALGAGAKVEGVYEVPFQAHAPMEPLNATAHVKADGVEIWTGCQGPQDLRDTVAGSLGLKPEQVVVHTTLLGGGFGRRYTFDTGLEAAQVSKAAGAPVQLFLTREDDIRQCFYRPFAIHRMSAALGADGLPTAWVHKMASTSLGTFWDPPDKVSHEGSEIGGAVNIPYAVPAFRMEYSHAPRGFPTIWWRSVEHSGNAFVVESFIDELAAAAKMDPLAYRLKLLAEPRQVKYPKEGDDPALDTQRFKAVLQLAAEKSGWGKPLPAGHYHGIAGHFSFHSYVAQVAEVSVDKGKVRVHKVTSAVDCGRVIHPDGVAAQVESSIVYGLTAALKSAITVKDGAIEQSNFHDYEMLRIDEMPVVEVHTVKSDAPPTGTGEPGLPPIAPAVANAIFAATGKRIRRMPIRESDLA
ncbi:MAG TPA: xanthine dehydrogenase family protein molybdopterin-binding subunit [Vicinamibacteria bacterium]|nr:xanthine dehydrogenase family protein molybdopterin-binding subunit [Vicinamibacteria bacterium]